MGGPRPRPPTRLLAACLAAQVAHAGGADQQATTLRPLPELRVVYGRGSGRAQRVAASAPESESGDDGESSGDASQQLLCGSRFMAPAQPPEHPTQHNGVRLPDTCFQGHTHHVFVIGDWGGVISEGKPPTPADHRSAIFKEKARAFIPGADDCAQQNVAAQMAERATYNPPDYILNVGDNFYWAGIDTSCGRGSASDIDETGQWSKGFEDIYKGPNLDEKQWLGVLGNHDFGGYLFTAGWDQVIARTWTSSRWVTPALFWSARVHYVDMSVDYYFADTNVWDAKEPNQDAEINICSRQYNKPNASCGVHGPRSVADCPTWFQNIWKGQLLWLERELSESKADWQIVVTHFPPLGAWGEDEWTRLAELHGIDLFISGHLHHQFVVAPNAEENPFGATAVIVSGGGGGITSEGVPDASGDDDEYGFMDLTLSKEEIIIEAISHGGQNRSTTRVAPRHPNRSGAPRHSKKHVV